MLRQRCVQRRLKTTCHVSDIERARDRTLSLGQQLRERPPAAARILPGRRDCCRVRRGAAGRWDRRRRAGRLCAMRMCRWTLKCPEMVSSSAARTDTHSDDGQAVQKVRRCRTMLNRKSVGHWAGGSTRRSVSGAGFLRGAGGYAEVVSGGVVEGDFLAGYPFEFGDELAFAAQRGEAVMPVGAEVGEAGGGVGEQVPDDGEDGVADGDQGAFLAAAPDDPLVAGGQEGPGPGGGDGGLAEGATEPGVALAGGGGFAAPGRLAGPRRELGPGHQVAWGREARSE